jgi:hypothetical protein
MSNASVASDRPIVRYPEVATHMMTCPTCKAAGGVKLTYEIGCDDDYNAADAMGACATGHALDRLHIAAYGDVTATLCDEVKRLVRAAIVTLGVDGCSITESLSEALDEILDETADPKYAEKIRRTEADLDKLAKKMGRPVATCPYAIDDNRADALMALESLARQDREDDFRTLAQRKGLEHADVLWSAMRFRYLEER